jgi:hypothetical protein
MPLAQGEHRLRPYERVGAVGAKPVFALVAVGSGEEMQIRTEQVLLTAAMVSILPIALSAQNAGAVEPIRIGSRLEPLIDDALIDQRGGSLDLKLHRPVRCPETITLDRPWEGNNSNYATILKDGDTYLFYYRGSALVLAEKRIGGAHYATTCVMTSTDGLHWTRPDLGFVKQKGWEGNNILLTIDPECRIDFAKGQTLDDGNDLLSGKKVPFTGAVHNFTPMIDANPECKPEERFKALGGHDHRLLYAYSSPDGIHWSMMQKEPVITDGMLDSQNLAFWDPVQGCYYAYYRDFKNKKGDTRKYTKQEFSYRERDVRVATSKDFLHWTDGEWIDWQPDRMTQLYTSQIQLYPGAENLRIGFPMRYIINRGLYSEQNERIAKSDTYYASIYTDTGLITSRDGRRFQVWPEALLRPGPTNENWVYSFGGTALNLFETPSQYPGGPKEWSFYVLDHGAWFGKGVVYSRYSVRKDGFVSASSPMAGGWFVTKPIVFEGSALQINFETSANGSARFELQAADGTPLPGLSLEDCPPLFGNSVAYTVKWKSGANLADHAGKPVRLKAELKDADLFAIQFVGQ